MKSMLFLLGAALLLAAPTFAQKVPVSKVPAAAIATFQALFATARLTGWEKEGADYEVSFRQGGKEMSAVISAGGQLKETETTLPDAELPPAVRTTLARDYRAARVGGAARIRRADGSTVYEAEISQGGKKQDVLFTAEGKVIK